MEVFEIILLMLGAVFLSNVANRFLPSIAVPLIQVIFGILLAIPLGSHSIKLNPELFLLLFMAPLLFNEGSNMDKKSFWNQKKPIMSLSLGLVFLTVFVLGFFINMLIPSIPIAAAFALAAALAPTDAVAVGALSEKVNVPHRIMHNLEGESLINDASGLVSFQFAVLALITGSFSLVTAGTSFLMLSFGGIILGALMSFLKIMLMEKLRELGIENITSYMLMEILLPFLIFITAEHLGVNGILAVVSGGIVHSFTYKRITPETAQLNTLSKNTWSVIVFSLNGLVFILLGTQLPEIIKTIWQNPDINNNTILLYIFAITFLLLLLRFLWILLFKNFEKGKPENFSIRIKTTLLYTVSGVRGTITLASALSLPLVLGNGENFLDRDLLIFIASGVIIITLLLANFTLHLFAPKREKNLEAEDHTMEIELLRDVVKKLKTFYTDENKLALGKVIKMYNNRIISCSKYTMKNKDQGNLKRLILQWQIENVKNLLENEEINITIAIRLINRLNRRLYNQTKSKEYKISLSRMKLLKQRVRPLLWKHLSFEEKRKQMEYIQTKNNEYILKNLKSLDKDQYNQEILDILILTYVRITKEMEESFSNKDLEDAIQILMELASQLERDTIQDYFEKGKITRGEAKIYRQNLLAIETNYHFND